MNFEFYPKSETRKRGLIYGKCRNYAPGQKFIVVCHGIGERGDESLTSLQKIPYHGMWGNLRALADNNNFNLIWTQSNQDNTIDEIEYAIRMGVEDLKGSLDNFDLFGVSWGGRRMKVWIMSGGLKRYKPRTMTPIGRGAVSGNDWSAVIESQVPYWLHHGVDDALVPESASSVSYIEGRKQDANAPIYYTEYLNDNNSATDEHVVTRYLSALLPPMRLVDPRYTVPKMSWWQWVEMNSWSKIPVSPDSEYKVKPAELPVPEPEKPIEEPTAPPVVDPAPVEPKPTDPVPSLKTPIDFAVSNAIMMKIGTASVPNNTLEVFWKDEAKTHEIFKAPAGFRCSGIKVEWTPEGNRYILDIKDSMGNRVTPVVVGPYKS